MPNSMTKLEINDVLSSIRRLVSGEKVDRKKSDLPGDDFFVLTPAHRIGENPVTSDVLPDLSLPEAENPFEYDVTPAPFELLNPAFPDHSVDEVQYSGALKDEYIQTVKEKSAVLTELFPEPVEPPESDDHGLKDHAPEVASTSLEDRIAELEEAVGRSDGDWEPDGSEDDTVQLPKRHLFEIPKHVAEASLDETEFEDQELEQTEVENTEMSFPEVEMHSDAVSTEDVTPLQLAEVATFTHVPRQKFPVAEPENIKPPEEVPSSAEILTGDDDIFVDEDLLRRVVSDIVREELQGKLGERMTRNIKRMVRREVEQSLSLRKFD